MGEENPSTICAENGNKGKSECFVVHESLPAACGDSAQLNLSDLVTSQHCHSCVTSPTFSLHFIKHRHAICKGSWILSYLWSLWGQRIFVFAIICRNSCSAYAWHCTSTGLSMKVSVTPPTPLPASSFGLCKGRRGSRNFWLTWGEL